MSTAAQLNTVYTAGQGLGAFGMPGQSADPIASMSDRSLNIRVVPANNGHIVSIREESYSHTVNKADLHIVPDDQDLGAVLGQLITLHYLKK